MNKTAAKYFILIAVFGLIPIGSSLAQVKDSVSRYRKNVIKLNLSSNILYKDFPLIEYERVIKRNKSFSIQAGYVTLPFGSGFTSKSLQLKSNVKRSGFTVTGDFRFYLPKENKDPAPHGVYIGPYISYHQFDNKRDVEVVTASGNTEVLQLNSNIKLLGVGAELGYQFLLGKRWTIDMILLAPSLTRYNVNMSLDGNLPIEEIDENVREILREIANRYPFVGDLLENKIATSSGRLKTSNIGLRYSIHVGFRF